MIHSCRFCAAVWVWALAVTAAWAQFAPGTFEISSAVSLDEADSTIRSHLERVKAFIADQQWDEAVESLRRVMETDGAKMIALTPRRYVNLADYCHVQIASLPDEALAIYRQQVDAAAEALYQAGIESRDEAPLARIVDTLFASSWGDDALVTLGEIELERGHHSAARGYWNRLIELPPGRVPVAFYDAARKSPELAPQLAELLDRWYVLDDAGVEAFYQLRGKGLLDDRSSDALVAFWKQARLPTTHLAYPGSELPRADIRARLILVSIMEGSLDRAREELAAFRQLHRGAKGTLAGRTVDYAETLSAMIAAAEDWPALPLDEDWPTYAGNYARNKVTSRNLDLGPAAWPAISLGEPHTADSSNSRAFSLRRIGEDAQRLLSYHPLVVGNLVLVNNQSQIFAFDRTTGSPAWSADEGRPRGEVFADENARLSTARLNRALGVPRFTMTVDGGKLYARMGSQVTSQPLESYESRSGGYLVCLDLAAEGRLVWKPDGRILPDDENWAFEGAPVVVGPNLYIAMRKSDVRPQAFVACFDAASGRRKWRTLICSAETPGGGQMAEITHNLLTYHQGTLYYNTNLGAVAAISSRSGRLEWATLYQRAAKAGPDGQDRRTAHYYRDLNPCVYDRGRLLVAPTDCDAIFALEAGTGELLWETRLAEDAVHLLGVGSGNLLASGDTLWWIDAAGGKVMRRWPDTSPLGHGRGILMGSQVIWPTTGDLFVLDQQVSGRPTPRPPIELSPRKAVGGNLVAAGGLLLIAAPDKLYAFRQQGDPPRRVSNVAARPDAVAPAPAKPRKRGQAQ